MGKLFGIFIGMLFSPLGAVIGFIIGAIIDSRTKFSFRSFFFSQSNEKDILKEAFPIFAAEVTRAGGLQKATVLAIKNIVIDLFGTREAIIIMQKFKNYVEEGYSPNSVKNACHTILYSLDHHSKIYLISMLFTILKAKGEFKPQEAYTIQNISRCIGISDYEFEKMMNHFINKSFHDFNKQKSYNNYNSFHNPFQHSQIDPYKILGINRSASNDEIKKRYRNLCKKYHPDLAANLSSSDKKKAENRMKEIIEAYDQLKKEREIK